MPPPFQGRPPWWDPNTPFPPAGKNWHPMRRRFMWRVGATFLGIVLLCVIVSVIISVVAYSFGANHPPEAPGVVWRPVGLVIFLVIVAVAALAFRAIRRAIEPVADVIEASQRVAAGDYATRVQVRGPGEVQGLTRAFNEMTTRLQTNDELRRQMLADVSHELRTPLTVIQGNLEGMLDQVYPMDRAHLEPVLDETRQLARLIEDLRTLALADSGALQLHLEPTDLSILVSETVASFRAQATAAGIALVADSDPALPNVNVDPARIRQVLENLIVNALRYTLRGGEIRVTCARDTNNNAVIAVNDTGRGIPPDELAHIFERFYKARDSRGTGLGLAIANSVIKAHHGAIFAESELDKGTKIWFTLPLT